MESVIDINQIFTECRLYAQIRENTILPDSLSGSTQPEPQLNFRRNQIHHHYQSSQHDLALLIYCIFNYYLSLLLLLLFVQNYNIIIQWLSPSFAPGLINKKIYILYYLNELIMFY